MTTVPLDSGGQVRAALTAIMALYDGDPRCLSDLAMMRANLANLLSDAPAERSVLCAAVEHDVPGRLRRYSTAGMTGPAAADRVAREMAARSLLRPEAVTWAVTEFATALGIQPDASAPAASD